VCVAGCGMNSMNKRVVNGVWFLEMNCVSDVGVSVSLGWFESVGE
jgi:hypothetical protein